MEAKRDRNERMKEILKSKGVSTQNLELLSESEDAPLPEPIAAQCREYEKLQQEKAKEKRKETAKNTFEDPWLIETEKKLYDLVSQKQTVKDENTLSGITGMIQMLSGKLKSFHSTMGTLKMKEALEERRRTCVSLGLLNSSEQQLVTSLSEPLPVPGKVDETTAELKSPQRDSGVFEGFLALNSEPVKRPCQSGSEERAKRMKTETDTNESYLANVLMSKGVTNEHVKLLPNDDRKPLPRPIVEDLARTHEELLQARGYPKDNVFAKYLPEVEVIPDSEDENAVFITPEETPRPASQSSQSSSLSSSQPKKKKKKKQRSAAKKHSATSTGQTTIKKYFA